MPPDAAPHKNHLHLADDILEGAEAIADFLFCGTSDHERGRNRRKVYYLAENCQLPFFRLGAILCVRKSVLLDFIASQEVRVVPPREYRRRVRHGGITARDDLEQGGKTGTGTGS
ncbi:hypothetical protein NLM31_12795 [Bradyrhizobium sp. CCGUVB4N]|uniref:hypothetical protein n=1 Tax=Bradyrhizobium sp. CCGUVB4N TaxID=2949631 RepID=UPI0020B3CECD|nr:hypothetical protein [Bradyrhizobium sp. CCGUVB4N]MCP3381218.1 hypothetical protein [Bradyrhizobium sp. CCGUVB4N]